MSISDTEFSEDWKSLKSALYKGNKRKTILTRSEYDKNGNRIRMDLYERKKISSYYEYTYDNNGNLTKDKWVSSDGRNLSETKYDYNEKKQLIKESHYDTTGTLSFWIERTYDADGNITEYVTYTPNSGVDFRIQYEYDHSGKRIKTSQKNSRGPQICKIFEYNDKGRVKRYIHSFDNFKNTSACIYEYDQNENVVKVTNLLNNCKNLFSEFCIEWQKVSKQQYDAFINNVEFKDSYLNINLFIDQDMNPLFH